jgi:PAS domain S-box-containing protein
MKPFTIHRLLAIFLFFALSVNSIAYASESKNSGQIVADKIASFAAKAIYNLDRDQLGAVLESFLDENPEIKALTITETIDQEVLLNYFRQDNKPVYDQPIPEELLKLKYFSAISSFEGEQIGTIEIYYNATSGSIKLTTEEKAWLKENPVWKVANETDWPPFDFAVNGNPTGYSIDLIKLVAKNVGAELEFINGFSWAQLMEKFKAGEIDVFPVVLQTEERLKFISFTKSYGSNPSVLVTHTDNSDIKSIANLKGRTVAVIKGSATDGIIEKRHPEIERMFVENISEGLQAVSAGQADALIGNFGVLAYVMEENFIPNIKIIGDAGLKKPEEVKLFMGVAKSREVFRNIIQKGLDDISADQKKVIRERWLGASTDSELLVDLTQEERLWLELNNNFSLGVDPSWAPFEFLDDEGVYSGIGSGYVDLVGSRLGISMKPVLGLSWTEVLSQAKAGKIDVIPTITRTPEREKFLHFSNPYISFPMVITTRKDAPFVDSLAGLNGKRVGVVKGYYTQELLAENHKAIKVVPILTLAGALKQLNDGEIDAFVDNLLTITHEIDRASLNDLKIASPTKYSFDLSMAVRKGLPELIPVINKALETVSERDRAAIVNTWTAIQVSYGIDTRTIMLWAVPLITGAILIIVVVIFWARYIQKQKLVVERSEKRLSSIIETAPDGIIVIDGKGTIQTFSPAAENIFGYKSDEMLGKNVSLLMPDETAALHDGYLLRHAETGQSNIIGKGREVEGLRKNGELFPMDLTVGMAKAGNQVFYTGSVRDVTERKKAETEQARILENLSAVMEGIDYGILFMDSNFRSVFCNKAFLDMWGIPADFLDGNPAMEDFIRYNRYTGVYDVPDEDFDEFVRERVAAVKGSDIPPTELIRADGKAFIYQNRLLQNGGTMLTYFEITERKQAEGQLQDAFEVISSSIDYASRIQRSVLPDGTLFSALLSDHFVLWEPRDVVGGDIYWSRMWGDGVLVILGDCTGHGVPGAFMTLIVTGALDNALTEIPCGQVALLMQRIHQLVQVTLGQHGEGAEADDGMELGMCYLGSEMDELTFVGARFELYLVEDGYVSTIKGTKSGIGYHGISYNQEYEEHKIVNLGEKSFYMTSDGLIDQVGGERARMFGKKRLRELLLRIQEKPMKDQGEILHQALIEYQGEQRRRDDVAVIGFKI